MRRKEILTAFKKGELTAIEVKEKLYKLKKQPFQNPLSEGQKGLWMLQKVLPEMSSYNIPLCFRVFEKVNIDKFKKACHFVLEEHPILTSVIEEDSDGVPYQTIESSRPLTFQQEDISNLKCSEILSYLREKAKEPFCLENGSLMRVHLLFRSEAEYIVLITIHHIVFDGASSVLLMTTLLNAYQELAKDRNPIPNSSLASYYDFIEWEHKMLISKEGEEHRSYWRQQLSGNLPILEIPADRPRFSSRSDIGETYTNLLTPELSKKIKSFAQSQHLNSSIVFLGIFKLLLHRYTGQEDIIVGMPTMGRIQEGFDSLIGYFVNMIPMRSQVEGTKSFSKFIRELQVTVVDGLDHAYPFPSLVRDLNIPRTSLNAPIFQVAFLYQNFLHPTGLKEWQSKLPIEFVEGIHQEGEYEFGLEVYEQEERFVLTIKYNSDLFDLSTITRMMGHYAKLTEEIIDDPSVALEEYSLLSKEEEITLTDWNETHADYPSDKCFHELFEKQAQKTPNTIAVVYEEGCLTYKELDERSSQMAIYLQKLGVFPDCLVGICVERSLEMIVGLLAILKAGGAYVPLDPHYPKERLEYMLQDSKASFLLTQSKLLGKISPLIEGNIKTIVLDKDRHEIEQEVKVEDTLKREVQSNHLAYVIYTSGSTGKPKGVMIPHRALTNFLISMGDRPGIHSQDRLLAVTTYCFDIAGLEFYLPLINGAQCYICSSEKAKDVEKLKREIQRNKPTIMQATPVTWTMLFHAGWKNEERVKILCGGEALPERLKQYFIDTNSDAWNMFGPTETTIWSTVQHIKKEESITIGKPIANTKIYILDNNGKSTPIGIPGELCIAGDGLARGYLNKPVLTAEKFIPNPFNLVTQLYKTGDLARWLADGNIEFLGRNDQQVKIRGFRIELGEIESQLKNHPEIQESVVIVNEQEGIKQLIAYYVRTNPGRDKASLSLPKLREYLKSNLPDYMIPVLFVEVDSIPLTPNGKIDRKDLMNRKIVLTGTKKTFSPPSEIEEKILEIWKAVLHNDNINIEDGFFEVGGDSLLAVAVAERIKKKLKCDFNVTTLFEYTNIKSISKYIAENKDTIAVSYDRENRNSGNDNLDNSEIGHNKKNRKSSYPEYYQDSLAIIGISCHFPGAKDHFEFWHNLREGKESVKFFSQGELRNLNIPEEIIQDPNYIPVQSTIEGKDLFDPAFFNISPKDAAAMDPQFRLLLLHSWKAIEDAGYIPRKIPETSVFMTASSSIYQALLLNSKSEENNILMNSDEYVSWILAQGGTIPTMISYKLGLKGPSFFVQSNCSSSLVALYSAYQSLRSDEAKYALVGGANIFPSSNLGYVYQPGLNFSSDGHIKAFDASADGMLSGEGAAVIVLKKAVDAIEDGDHIYALLRGIGLNNDGSDKVGFYAPSIKGQAEVIRKVLNSTQINPDSISYMEAHGTGTKLGDPIEHTALSDIYKQYTTKKQFCGIGSVKTNIGHLDAAAGLAGCIKVALSLYHNEIPPTINFKKPNPNIDFTDSPFYVVNKIKKLEKNSSPYRAALSSFGIGGTNTHAIFEQYTSVEKPEYLNRQLYNDNIFYMLPISAKNNDRLKDYAQNLLSFLKEPRNHNDDKFVEAAAYHDINLADLAYTFQVGREEMENRLIFVFNNKNELIQKLEEFIDGRENIDGCFRGEVKQAKDSIQLFKKDDEFEELIHKWITKGKVRKIAELWSKGLCIDWELLYLDAKPHRISVTTYPFAKERFWISKIKAESISGISANTPAMMGCLHPLLHQNTSNLSEQRFSSTFTGQELFWANHVVKGQRVLPEVAYLEMVRAAVEQATKNLEEVKTGIRLKNVIWDRPIVLGDKPVQLHIGLFPEDKGEIAYEIYSQSEESSGEIVVYNQGSAALFSSTKDAETLDVKALQVKCKQNVLSSTQCYEAYRKMGISYGAEYQGIEKIYVGLGQVLAKLKLPSSVAATQDQFVLHPSLVDSAVQASLGLMMSSDNLNFVRPLTLKEIEILGNCTFTMWALLRFSDGSKAVNKTPKFDIDLCDDQGKICVRVKEMELHENTEKVITASLEPRPQNVMTPKIQEDFEMMTFEEILQEEALSKRAPVQIKTIVCFLSNLRNQQAIVEAIRTLEQQTNVLFISQGTTYQKHSQEAYTISRSDKKTYEQAFQSIREEYGEVDAVLYLWPLEDSIYIQDYSVIVYMLQSIAAVKLKAKQVLLGAQFENGLERCYLDSWIGFERSLRLVLPNTQVAVMYQESGGQKQESFIKDWMKKIWSELQTKKLQSVCYQKGKRHVYQIKATTLQMGNCLLQTGGTYLITGGCGGLGFLFAKHFAKTKPVNLILTGRSPMDEKKQNKIKEIEELGSQVLYLQADTCNVSNMKAVLIQAKEKFGKIDGVLHAAGLADSQSIFEKDMEDFKKIVEPKIKGTLVLDEVLQTEALHFICYFSSSSAILGDFGSCDYAIGNRFQTAYAFYRNVEQRQGKTLVINWPLWRDGGMGVGEEENSKMYLKSSSQRYLEAEEGVLLFDQLLAQTNTQHLILVGNRSKVYRFLELTQDQSSMPPTISLTSSGKGRRMEMKGLSFEQCLEWDLKEHISQLLKISRDKLDREDNLADFGFDSISLAQFANLLTNHYGIEITPALFFGHSTIEKLIQYFFAGYQETMQLFYQESTVLPEAAQEVLAVTLTSRRQEFKKIRIAMENTPQSMQEPIAIIGMSGRFPQASTIDEMWKILADGKDVIQDFPADRFSGKGKSPYQYGAIPGVSEFDPLFFEISPREAESMDPRQRLLLQESWKALEDAGYGSSQIQKSKIGMFVGVEEGDYRLLLKEKSSITSNHNAVLSARLAYFLNLSGPNMAINTACSSGLVAVHQACQSIRQQECDTALAAGVNLLLTPQMFQGMSEAGMLSEDGKCFAFDKRANGMVPAEAVAVVVLKRLSQAKADKDPIYAVIKGSGINYDGKTNGITAPSGASQTKLLKSVYDQYQINPEDLEYIVTHGTGTKLGDPIEVNALYDAFKDYTKKQGYCALTSTKTNFGHALAASGLVSLISLVQAFRHETIPASLHFQKENEYIQWSGSPFYVNKESKAWPEKEEKRRMGGVSAFGMSGTNVHMVLESYPENRMEMKKTSPCYLLAFSAKTQESLQEKCKEMIVCLEKEKAKSLGEISFTLLEGRQHFAHRCAVVVQDKEDGIYVLQQMGSKEKLPNLFKGIVARDFTGQKAIEEYGQELLAQSFSQADTNRYKEILHALADLYCQGYDLAWRQLYGEEKPNRLHLPGYPFAKESYWVPEVESSLNNRTKLESVTVIHPLLHQNTSDFSEQRFSSSFTGEEFFLKDHIVKGQRILPGVAHLEMAWAAAQQTAGALMEEKTGMRLKDIIWAQPIVVGEEAAQVHIGLFPKENGEISYEIYSQMKDNVKEAVIHNQGSIALVNYMEERKVLDLKALQAECSQGILSAAQCYKRLKAAGMEYDTRYQGIESVYLGVDQVLTKLVIPSSILDTQEQFNLHPCLLDSAMQVIGLQMTVEHCRPAAIIALEELAIIGQCISAPWVRICRDRKSERFDMDFCDDQGTVYMQMKGLEIQVYTEEMNMIPSEKNSQYPKIHNSQYPVAQGRRAEMKGFTLEQCIDWDLKEQVSQLLKIPRDKLDREENLAEFGFDSISLSEFAGIITNHYSIEFTPALFFGYSTLKNLTQYFLTEYQDVMQLHYREAVMEEGRQVVQAVPAVTLISKRQTSIQSRFITKPASQEIQEQEPIAIIGMSGRFPEARTIDEMWQILAAGKDVIQDFPADRFSGKGKSPYQYGAIPGVSEFDPLFFEISPREAESMDPRQRLLLQESWKALEDAGYGSSQIQKSKIGMFVGVEEGDYRLLLKEKSSITSNHNAVLSARLAYFLNLSGPNMAINTACSSGLVAVHQACQSIRQQECDTALAAGVNLLLTPQMFQGMSEAGMLSEDGKCFAFDKRANGMVPAEAVAVVVLKRLSQAKADKDPIYAVIKGSGINYDGKTNGITAPSGASQTKLLKSVYDQYQINPEDLEYIVTHGTGTKLGDPIEVNALYDAFKDYTKKQGYCALTSTKTNFGHALAASGLVSLISLVQAFRHETIPASLHFQKENEYIQWSGSPFYVNKESKAWPEKEEKRRMGGVSAFGMSGTNVHMVLESYPENRMEMKKTSPCYLLAFSAKTQESLQEKCKEMIVCLEKEKAKSLGEISFTLLEGRQHFAHRCAVVVQDKEDGIYVLQQMGSKEKLPNLFKGIVARDFTGQKAIEEYGQELLAQSFSQADTNRYKEILHALADLYCQGYDLAWRQLYGEEKPNRLHLPGYPFAKESYWVPEVESSLNNRTKLESVTVIHPLLHQNTSDFSEQRFSSSFTGEEFFLKDHIVKGQRILPGVAYLEMARAAVQQAAGRSGKENIGIQIKNVVWSRPIGVGEEAVQVHIGLFPEENGEIAYEIYSHLDESLEEAVVHSQGNILLRPACEVKSLPIEQIRKQCSREILSSSQCYEQLRTMGLEYGPGHQGIETLYIGDNQVLAKLLLPAFLLDTQDSFILHPSMMDSALQASMGLMIGSGSLKPALPFALQELEVMAACTPSMWAVVRYSPGSKGEDKVQKLDIALCNEEGTLCVRMKGFSARILEGEIDSGANIDMLLYQHGWKEKCIDQTATVSHIDQHMVILCEPDQGIQDSTAMNMNGVRCIALQRKGGNIAVRFQGYAYEILEEIRAILKEKTNSKALIQIVIFSNEQMPFFGFSGLLKTAHLENARLIGQIIEVEPEDSAQSIREKLIENSHQLFDSHIRYQDGKRWVTEWKEIEDTQDTVKIPWKDQGVYLITGGSGGLGLIFAQDIARQAKSATIILTGRSAFTQEMQTKWQGIVTLGARVEYRQADVTDQQVVSRLVEKIQEEFGGLHGILHCAGVIRDNFILKKTQEEMREVLSPKVLGLVNLDQATKDMKLDFFILFSSIAGSLGNAGQADYAAANAFMDAYAEYRNDLAARQQRQGKTLSMNWPLWQEGGMGVDEITEKIMMQNMGMIALQTANGIQALYQSIGAGENQVMVMVGKADQFRMALEQNHPDERGEHSSVYAAAGDKIINQDLYQKLFDEIAAGVLSEEEFSTLMKV